MLRRLLWRLSTFMHTGIVIRNRFWSDKMSNFKRTYMNTKDMSEQPGKWSDIRNV